MANAYTPGLTVSSDIVVRRIRRLPIKGDVLVAKGDQVQPEDSVARALLPGPLQTIKLAEALGIEAKDAIPFFQLKIGDSVEAGQMVAQTKGFLMFKPKPIHSNYSGTIESISDVTGNVLVREAPIPVEVKAYIQGTVAEVMPEEGAIVETRCAMVQGIFGVGGERTGVIRHAVAGHDQILHADDIRADDAGRIVIGGAGVTLDAISRASEVGVIGIVAGGIRDSDLIQFLGYDIGVAITGQEDINLTIVVTEGFGFLNMAKRTFDLLKSLDGQIASINGATQIRAGVIRPEVIVPMAASAAAAPPHDDVLSLMVGTPIRVIREPYFGQLGRVTDLPAALMVVDSGTEVRVLKAQLDGGDEVVVPRANVEILAT